MATAFVVMALLTEDIKKRFSDHGFAEIEGERMRLGWPAAPSKPENPSVEERVHRWADLNGRAARNWLPPNALL
jgi:hypothetical protein